MTIEFPQYRKYVGVETYFKITSDSHFVELKRVGKTFVRTEVDALQYPEKLRIQDMLECRDGAWEIVSEADFQSIETSN